MISIGLARSTARPRAIRWRCPPEWPAQRSRTHQALPVDVVISGRSVGVVHRSGRRSVRRRGQALPGDVVISGLCGNTALDELAVHPVHRRRGIAARLVGAAVAGLVTARRAEAAVAAYRRWGWDELTGCTEVAVVASDPSSTASASPAGLTHGRRRPHRGTARTCSGAGTTVAAIVPQRARKPADRRPRAMAAARCR